MRILYGITGEGLGHTMRARVVLPHLAARGHAIKIAASGRACDLFRAEGWDVVGIEGFALRHRDGATQRIETVLANAARARDVLRVNAGRAFAEATAFRPDVVVSDFESFTYGVGRALGRPVVSFDHHHVITRFRHPKLVQERLSYDFRLTRAIVRGKLPSCARYLVSSFYFPAPRANMPTDIFGPVVRPAVQALRPTEGEHVLVYQTAAGDEHVLAALAQTRELPFRVYGLGARPAAGNVTFHAFDEARFLADLASARAVVANGGYMTLSEALVLGKPVLSSPLRHHGEQELNAAWLAHLGLGLARRRIAPADLRAIVGFRPRAAVAPATTDALAAIDRALRTVTAQEVA
jgi:uncharacterized protein (TIGR00661 family)